MARGPIDPAEFGSITVVVIMCLLQIAALCLAGCVAAWKEVITPSVRKSSVVLNVSFFTPALIFGKVAFDLTPEILASLWIVPVGFLVLSIVSAFVAWMVGFIFNLRKGYLILAIAASTFMNSNTLPIALMGTFSNSLKELKKTGKESPDYILSKSVTILAICASLGTVLRWSFGVYMLDHAKVETESKQSKNNNEEVTSFISVMNLSESKTHKTQAQKKSSYSERLDVEEIKVDEELPSTGLEYGAIAPPTALTTPLPFSAQEVLKAQEKPLNGQLSEKNSSKKYKVAWKSFLRGVADFFNPPLLSSILAIIVSCIPPLQKSLGSVKAIRGFLTMAGNVAIPLTLVNLGALFYHSRSKIKDNKIHRIEPLQAKDSQKNSRDKIKTTVAAIFSRQVLAPAIMLPLLLVLSHKTNLEVAKDPIFLISSALVICSPPAITLSQMVSKARDEKFECMVSDILFWSHTLVTPFITIIAVIVAIIILKSS